jgi:hypothetical protein
MLFQLKNNNSVKVNPQLSRVWIKTGNPKLPLKSVWLDEAKLRFEGPASCGNRRESESRDLAEDHLVLAA